MKTQVNSETVATNSNSLQPDPKTARLAQLKAAVYDCNRQIQFLAQIKIPELEREIAELEQD